MTMLTDREGAPVTLPTSSLAGPAPRAPWWRRLLAWAHGVEQRSDRRRRRHWFARRYPESTWRQRDQAARLERDIHHGEFVEAVTASWELEEHSRTMGPSPDPWRPMPFLSRARMEQTGGRLSPPGS